MGGEGKEGEGEEKEERGKEGKVEGEGCVISFGGWTPLIKNGTRKEHRRTDKNEQRTLNTHTKYIPYTVIQNDA